MNKIGFLLRKLIFLFIVPCNRIILFIADIMLVIYDIFSLPVKFVCNLFVKFVKSSFFFIKDCLFIAIDFCKKDKRRAIAYFVTLLLLYKVISFSLQEPDLSLLGKKDEISVLVRKVTPERIEKVVNCYGTIESEDSIRYFSEVNGTVSKILVKQKSRVKKGQLLMIIDSKTLQEAYVGAKSFLEVKNMQYKAIQRLYKEGLESAGNLRSAKAEVENARSTFEKVKKEYQGLNIYAPFDGYIDNIDYKEYSQVNVGSLLFTLEKVDVTKVECDLRSIYANELEIGNDVSIFLSGLHVANGKVTNVSENVDVFTGNKVISIGDIVINNGYKKTVKPGVSVKIKIAIKLKKDLYKISSESLSVADSGDFIVKILSHENGEISAKNIVVYDDCDGYEYVSGLDDGDLVIERGHEFVKLGKKNVKYRLVSEVEQFDIQQGSKKNESDKTVNTNVFLNKIYFNLLEFYGWSCEFYKKKFTEIKKEVEMKVVDMIDIVVTFIKK